MTTPSLPADALAPYDLTPPVTPFALTNLGLNNTALGIRTGTEDYVLKSYYEPPNEDGLAYEHRLLEWLSEQTLSFVVPAPIPTITGDTWHRTSDGCYVLLPFISGRRPNPDNPVHVEAVGAALGELHTILRAYPTTPRPYMATYAGLDTIHPCVQNPTSLAPQNLKWPHTQMTDELCAWWNTELETLQIFLQNIYPSLPQQMIHGDFAFGNTLYKANRISAIIDFEFSGPAARVMDVSAGLKFSLRLEERSDPWTLGSHSYRGYKSQVELTQIEIDTITSAMLLSDVVSTIWWLGRDLSADRAPPDMQRMIDFRNFRSWIQTHEVQFKQMLTASPHSATMSL